MAKSTFETFSKGYFGANFLIKSFRRGIFSIINFVFSSLFLIFPSTKLNANNCWTIFTRRLCRGSIIKIESVRVSIVSLISNSNTNLTYSTDSTDLTDSTDSTDLTDSTDSTDLTDNYFLQYLQILWGNLFLPQLGHLTNLEKDLIFETRLLPFRAVDRFDFGNGAIRNSG